LPIPGRLAEELDETACRLAVTYPTGGGVKATQQVHGSYRERGGSIVKYCGYLEDKICGKYKHGRYRMTNMEVDAHSILASKISL